MASIVVLNHTPGKVKRTKIDGINLSDNVKPFRNEVGKIIEVSDQYFDLVYCGRCLRDDKPLESYGIKPGVTVHVMPRSQSVQQPQAEPMDKAAIKQVVTALQTALLNPAYRNTVERMLHDSEALDNIISATPGLQDDAIAVAILQDAEMLAILADPAHVYKVIEKHPALGHAAMMVAAAVSEEGAKEASRHAQSARGAYSLDQMSDDEDLEGVVVPPGRGGAGGSITASQLAAALAAAGAPPQPQPGGSGSSAGTSDSSAATTAGGISADFFRQAIAQATQQSEEQMVQSQLAQMRDMGITDEAVARQALQATAGDLQAAIELLFGDSNLS